MNKRILTPCLAILGAATALASVTGAAQDNDEMERKLRELNIMNTIFEAAMEQGDGSGRFNTRRVGHTESMYLAGQGMVFSFHLMNNRGFGGRIGFDEDWMENLEESLARTRETLERVQESFPGLDLDLEDEFDLDMDLDMDEEGASFFVRAGRQVPRVPAVPRVPRVYMFAGAGPEAEALEEMEEAMRDTQREIRDLQRQIRDEQRELRDDDNEAATIEAEIAGLEESMAAEMARLEEQRVAYEAFLTDITAARMEQQQALANEVTDQLITTLCDYGATLRTLEADEHVTLILEEVAENNDQIYVFNYADIRDCRSMEGLKQQAVAYQMPRN